MAVNLLSASTREQFVARLQKIGPETPRQWGTMSPAQMFAHLRRTIEISLAEVEVKDESNFLLRNVLGPLAFSGLFQWPRGKMKVLPVFLGSPDGNAEEEKRKLIAAVDRFVAAAEAEPARKTLHAALGWMTLDYWKKVHGIHTDHHLRQFGV